MTIIFHQEFYKKYQHLSKTLDTAPQTVYYITMIWGSGGMAYTGDLKSPALGLAGSNPAFPTINLTEGGYYV